MSGIYALINFTLEISNENKHYVEANAIANQKIEQIRNLPYKDIGTISGSPTGTILAEETIITNGTYNIQTDIQFVDDPFDGLASTTDNIFTDYKNVTIKVSWNTKRGEKHFFLSSKIAPPTEEASEGYGLIEINVTNSNYVPVAGADINFTNPNFPEFYVTYQSDENGQYTLAVLPDENYQIEITNGSGTSTFQTYQASTTTGFEPNAEFEPIEVIENGKASRKFVIDRLGHLKIKTVSTSLPENYKINEGLSGDGGNSKLSIDASGNIYIVWQETAGGIYAQKSDSMGNNWANDVTISSDGQSPDICFSNNAFYVSWCDSVGDCYLNKRNENGASIWEYKINSSSSSTNAKIFASPTSTDLFTVFQVHNGNDYDVYWRKFDAFGNRSSEVLLTDNSFEQVSPDIVVDSNNNSYVVWTQYDSSIPDYDLDIHIQKVNENGILSWTKKVNIDNTYRQYHPAIYLDDDNDFLYIAWTDERNGISNIYFKILDSSNGSLNQSEGHASVDYNYSQSLSSIYGNGSNVYITWTDKRNGNEDIYSQKISGTFWSHDSRVNIDSTGLDHKSSDLAFDENNDKFIASWDDTKNIYFGEVRQINIPNPLNNVSVNIHSSKRIGYDNNGPVYNYSGTSTSNSLGEINLDLEWDSIGYVITIPGRTIEMIELQPSNTVKLLAGDSQEIIFYLE